MRKKIVLVQSKAGSFEMLGTRLPTALLSIAAIPYQKGYDVQIIDQRTDRNWRQRLQQALEENPICVGVTCMTGKQIFHALEASKLVKRYSAIPVIWGGVHATLLPEQTLANPYIDIVAIREGELTFIEIVEALERGQSLKGIKGIYYKKDGKVIKNPERDFIKNLDSLPELPWELIDIDNYASLHIKEGRSLDFVSSRGCPFRCSFCYNAYFNKAKWRPFSAKETVKRLKNLVRTYNIKTVYFQDDNFCSDINRLKEILHGILEEKLDIKWGTLGLRVDTSTRMDDKTLRLMQKSGCVNVDIGGETGAERLIKLIDKRISIKDMLAVNRRLAGYPFIIKYTFMIGFPTETKEETFSTIKLALKLTEENRNAYTPFSVYTPYPRTPMYDFAVSKGFAPPQNLQDWQKFNMDDWYFNFKSWMSPMKIRELRSVAFTSLFSNKNIKYKINKVSTRFLFNMYHPIAKFRFKNYFHYFPIDSLMSKELLDKIC